jgi:hypothetical protein
MEEHGLERLIDQNKPVSIEMKDASFSWGYRVKENQKQQEG